MAFWTYMLRCSDGRYYTGHIVDNWSLVSHFAKPPRERFSTSLETNGGGETETGMDGGRTISSPAPSRKREGSH